LFQIVKLTLNDGSVEFDVQQGQWVDTGFAVRQTWVNVGKYLSLERAKEHIKNATDKQVKSSEIVYET
jgi:superfamily I DNA and RNA helicase